MKTRFRKMLFPALFALCAAILWIGALLPARAAAGQLDCVSNAALSGEGYEWNGAANTLTLSGDVSVSGGAAILLPPGAVIQVNSDCRVTGSVSSSGMISVRGRGKLIVTSPESSAFSVGGLLSPDFTLSADEAGAMPLSSPSGSSVVLTPVSYHLQASCGAGGTVSPADAHFFAGDAVTVEAHADPGYVFSGWVVTAGGIEIDANSTTLNFSMPSSDVSLIASFTVDSRTFTVEVQLSDQAGGRASFLSKDFNVGSNVVILATPREGYTFGGWSSSQISIGNPGDPTLNFTMPANHVTVYLNFKANTYYFTVSTTGGGTVEVEGKKRNGDGKYECSVGEEITLFATAKENYVFGGWSASGGANFDDIGEETATLSCPASDFSVRAQFASTIKKLTIASSEGGSVSPEEGSANYGVDCVLDLKAVPDDGYVFSEWQCSSEKGAFANPKKAETTFTMPDVDCTVTAVFSKGGYKLTLLAASGGTVSKVEASYEMGASVPISATALQGYVFSHWDSEEEGIIADPYAAETTVTMPGKNIKVTAVFVLSATLDSDGIHSADGDEEGFPWGALILAILISAIVILLLIIRERYNLSYRYLIGKAFRSFFARFRKKK